MFHTYVLAKTKRMVDIDRASFLMDKDLFKAAIEAMEFGRGEGGSMGMYARERYLAALKANKTEGLVGPNWDNHAFALATVQDEVSGEKAGLYDLTPEIRDTLLVHARQDAAHALLNTATLIKEVQFLRRLIVVTLILVAVCTVVVVRRLM